MTVLNQWLDFKRFIHFRSNRVHLLLLCLASHCRGSAIFNETNQNLFG